MCHEEMRWNFSGKAPPPPKFWNSGSISKTSHNFPRRELNSINFGSGMFVHIKM